MYIYVDDVETMNKMFHEEYNTNDKGVCKFTAE